MDTNSGFFEDLVGSSLTVAEAGIDIEVTSVTTAGQQHTSVLFTGPEAPILDQATYTLRHGSDSMLVFIVPIESRDARTVYEAVFSAEPPPD
jgi:hypothetical protein